MRAATNAYDDDCWLPYCKTKISELTKSATITSTGEDVELLLNGIERHYGDDKNCWSGKIGDTVTFSFESEKAINEVRFVFNTPNERTGTADMQPIRRYFYRADYCDAYVSY